MDAAQNARAAMSYDIKYGISRRHESALEKAIRVPTGPRTPTLSDLGRAMLREIEAKTNLRELESIARVYSRINHGGMALLPEWDWQQLQREIEDMRILLS